MSQDRMMRYLIGATAVIIVLCIGVMVVEEAGYALPTFVPAAVKAVMPDDATDMLIMGQEDGIEVSPDVSASSENGHDEATVSSPGGQDVVTSSSELRLLVNINEADLEQLMTLPGIGPVIGRNIIDYRARVGGFSSVEQLIYVERIGEKTLENLRPYVTVQ